MTWADISAEPCSEHKFRRQGVTQLVSLSTQQAIKMTFSQQNLLSIPRNNVSLLMTQL